ncbi:MAG: pseudouridine-5'-phosphate glycosidase, partial [Chloroflexota bacterium]
AFYSTSSGLPVASVSDPAAAAEVWRAHRALGGAGMLLAVPPPPDVALAPEEVEGPIARALARAEAAGIRGQAVTPFLLAAVAEETHGESVRTNVALLRQNARVAAQVALALAEI